MLEIIRPGLQTTVQDAGRQGSRHLGVAQAGALDLPALSLANRLAGNPTSSAGLEIAGGPVAIRFLRDAWLATSGADYEVLLDQEPIWCGWRWPVRCGQVLRLSGPRHGMRLYLAVDGGIDVPLVLGGRATDLAAGFGGLNGRALQVGDTLPLGAPVQGLRGRCGARLPQWNDHLRALPGPEYEDFDAASRAALWGGEWTVTAQGDRMGQRLQGPVLTRARSEDLPSHGVLPGIVQVPPSGQPIVLLADAQTTGGYPRIASVIEADLWKIAQAKPGTRMRLVETDLDGAMQARKKWQQHLRQFEWSAYGK
jgi:biotin-dependent carboxylase-like uncharacterized protein